MKGTQEQITAIRLAVLDQQATLEELQRQMTELIDKMKDMPIPRDRDIHSEIKAIIGDGEIQPKHRGSVDKIIGGLK